MSHEELLRCQTEEQHNGQIFICPNTNLIWNDIRSTCLGAIFFSHQAELEGRCDHRMVKTIAEQARQISKNEILIFTDRNLTVTEKCRNGTRYHQVMEGLVRKSTEPGCELSTRDFTFRSLEDIDLSENHVEREIRTTKFGLLQGWTDNRIKEALKALRGMKEPEHVNVDQLKIWLQEDEKDSWSNWTSWTMTGVAGVVGLSAVLSILFLFWRYKLSKNANEK